MKNILIAILLSFSVVGIAVAKNDTTIGIEFGFGFGKSAARTDSDNTKFTKCRNRNWGGLTTVMVRVKRNDLELHGGRWFHDTDVENCNRTSNVVGLGYEFSTEGHGIRGQKDRYLTYTPGIAFVWSDEKHFTKQRPPSEQTYTNWRMSTNWHMFNRVAVGAGDEDRAVELAYHHYGAFNDDSEVNTEEFITVGVFKKKLHDNERHGGNPPVGPPPSCEDDNSCEPPPPPSCEDDNSCEPPPPPSCEDDNSCEPPPPPSCEDDNSCEPPPPPSCEDDNSCEPPPPPSCEDDNSCEPPPPPSCEDDNSCEPPPLPECERACNEQGNGNDSNSEDDNNDNGRDDDDH